MSRSQQDSSANLALAAIVAVWGAAAALIGSAGGFATPAGQPPLALLAAVVGPLFVFAVAYWSSGSFRQFVRSGDPLFLTNLQSWRILGGMFLVLMWFGMLPAVFAVPAGWGDLAIGAAAPFVARAAAWRGLYRTGQLFILFQVLGLVDLVVAVGSGAAVGMLGLADGASTASMGRLPLSLIPTYAVPLFAILHFAAIAQYRERTRVAAEPRRSEPVHELVG
jgi:hypothetical protein